MKGPWCGVSAVEFGVNRILDIGEDMDTDADGLSGNGVERLYTNFDCFYMVAIQLAVPLQMVLLLPLSYVLSYCLTSGVPAALLLSYGLGRST